MPPPPQRAQPSVHADAYEPEEVAPPPPPLPPKPSRLIAWIDQDLSEAENWRPLSFAEKNILKVKKKLREIEKIEELQKDGAVLETTQRQKVAKRGQLEAEMAQLSVRSREQGDRSLEEIERAEVIRRKREDLDNAAVAVQRVLQGYWVRRETNEIRAASERERQRIAAEAAAAEQRRRDEEAAAAEAERQRLAAVARAEEAERQRVEAQRRAE